MGIGRRAGLVAVLLVGSTWPCEGQHPNPPVPPPQAAPPTVPEPYNVYRDPTLMKGSAPTGDPMEDKRQEYLHSVRGMQEQKRELMKDASRLLRLANELQATASKNDPATLQETMLRQVEAIERLAHRVNERMKEMQ